MQGRTPIAPSYPELIGGSFTPRSNTGGNVPTCIHPGGKLPLDRIQVGTFPPVSIRTSPEHCVLANTGGNVPTRMDTGAGIASLCIQCGSGHFLCPGRTPGWPARLHACSRLSRGKQPPTPPPADAKGALVAWWPRRPEAGPFCQFEFGFLSLRPEQLTTIQHYSYTPLHHYTL